LTAGIVTHRAPDLRDQVRHIHLGHEGVRPQHVVQLRLREDSVAVPHKNLEEIERLPRNGDRLPAVEHQPAPEIQLEIDTTHQHHVSEKVRIP
jgi:hypothetical protein